MSSRARNLSAHLVRAWPGALLLAFAAGFTSYCLSFIQELARRFPDAAQTLQVDRNWTWALGATLACLAPWARRIPPVWASLLAGALVGALLYMRTFGWAWLDPTAIDWLLQGDLAQHYFGWALFRQEPWHWPPGAIDALRYPLGSSVFFTDAYPLLAFVFKPLSGLLPEPFQYIGLTYLLSWTLMGATTATILRLLATPENDVASDQGGHLLVHALGALLVVLSPTLVARIGHDTLTAQWLIVAALGLAFWRMRQPSDHRHRPAPVLAWCLLAGTAALTHLYLLGMVLAILATDGLQALVRERSIRPVDALRWAACVLAVSLMTLWLAGAFTVPGKQTLDYDNPGRWSADLFSLFDTHGMSRLAAWLPRLPMTRPEQWEGWAYLGVGAMVAIVLAGLAFIVLPRCRAMLRHSGLLWLAAVVLFLFALSPVVTAAGATILDSEWLKRFPAYALFRSCGRFVWPLHYLLLLSALLVLARSGARVAIPVLALACVLQIVDLRIHDSFGERRVAIPAPTAPRLLDPRWLGIVADHRHLELVPGHGCGKVAAHWFSATDLAARHGLTVNSGYVARIEGTRWQRYCGAQAELIDRGARRDDTVYLVHAEHLDAFTANSGRPMRCQVIDDLDACVVDTTGGEHPAVGPDGGISDDEPDY